MTTNAKIAVAVVGGYVLGRTKKARLALGLGMFLAGRKLPLNPEALRKALMESPVLAELNGQVREQIVDATRDGAKGALTRRIGSLADTLHQRTLGLDGAQAEDEAEDEEAPVQDGEGTAPEDGDGGDSGEETSRRGRAASRSTTRRAASAAGKAGRTAAKSSAPAGKASGRGAKPVPGKGSATTRKTSAGAGRGSTSSRRTKSGGDGNG